MTVEGRGTVVLKMWCVCIHRWYTEVLQFKFRFLGRALFLF